MHQALQPEYDKPLEIVVLDDNNDDLKWISRLAKDLVHQCTVHAIQDSEMLGSTLLDHASSVVLVDYQLGEHNGIDLIRQFHKHFPDVAFVLITSMGSEQIMTEAIRAGASDFIRKEDINVAMIDELIDRVLQNVFRYNYARMAITALSEGIITTDANRNILRCNPAVEAMLDQDESEVIGRPIEDFFVEADEEIIHTLFSLSDSSWNSQPELKLKSLTDDNDDQHVVSMSVSSMVAARNKSFIVVLKHIFASEGDLKPVDKQLAIIDATPDFVGYSNCDGEIYFLNPAAKALLGIEDLNPLDRITLFELFSPVMQRSFARTIFPKLIRKGLYIGNGVVNGKHRKDIPVSIVMNGLTDLQGNLETITFILREVSPPSTMN